MRDLSELVVAVQDSNREVRIEAVKELRIIGIGDAHALEPLCAALADDDLRVARDASNAVIHLGQVAVPKLLSMLEHEKAGARSAAACALGRIGGEEVVEPLIGALRDKDSSVIQHAAIGLGRIGDRRAVEPLMAALKHKESSVRRLAATALGEIGDAAAAPLLTRALNDRDPDVRWAAKSALERVRPPRTGSNVQEFIRHLRSEYESQREEATVELGALGDPEAIYSLIALFDDEYVSIRGTAASAVARIGPQAIEPLRQAYNTRNANVRRSVAEALGKIRDPKALELILEIAQRDDHSSVRRAAASALLGRNDARLNYDFAQSIVDGT